MATSWKSQQGDGKYYLQFETDDIDKYKLVEKASQMAIDGIAEADVEEVVRCRECKHCEIWNNDWYFCKETVNNAEVKADDFCSYGEKREGQCRFEDRMDEKEIAKIKKAIEMIDDYLQEPNSIAEDWVMVLKLCRQALKEMVKK